MSTEESRQPMGRTYACGIEVSGGLNRPGGHVLRRAGADQHEDRESEQTSGHPNAHQQKDSRVGRDEHLGGNLAPVLVEGVVLTTINR